MHTSLPSLNATPSPGLPAELADSLHDRNQRMSKVNPVYWRRAEAFVAASPCPGILPLLPVRWDFEHYLAITYALYADFDGYLAGLFLQVFERKLQRYADWGYAMEDYMFEECARDAPRTLEFLLAPAVGCAVVDHPYFQETLAHLLTECLQALSVSCLSAGGPQ